jgi:hypothetical protein
MMSEPPFKDGAKGRGNGKSWEGIDEQISNRVFGPEAAIITGAQGQHKPAVWGA